MDPILQNGSQAANTTNATTGANGPDAQVQQEMAKAFQQVLMQVVNAAQGEAMQ